MKKILSLLNSRISRICVACMAMLGFTACSGEEADMYGTPYADFEVKGAVRDAAGNPVTGATLKATYPNQSSGVKVIGMGVTNASGEYECLGNILGGAGNDVKVVCIPSDPTLEPDSTVVKLNQAGMPLKDWNNGRGEATVDFVLKKKEAK